MHISRETPEQTDARLARVLAVATFVVLEGTYTFEEMALSAFPACANPDAVALVRDDAVWSQLVPCLDPSRELFRVFRFHFPAGIDNSGFVGWLASHLKQALGTGVFVVCGQNSRQGGIFDYWGCPAALGDQVEVAIRRMRTGGQP